MFKNAGLFILVWESVSVLVGTVFKVFNPSFGVRELLIQALVMLPVALFATRWIDRALLTPRPTNTDEFHHAPATQTLTPTQRAAWVKSHATS